MFIRYKLAEKMSEKLDEMGKDLGEMIAEINNASTTLNKNSKADDPVSFYYHHLKKPETSQLIWFFHNKKLSQVVRILNSHLIQLQEIDQGTAALQAKVAAAQRNSQTLRQSAGFNGPTSEAADGFYRSYLGRR